ncbi:MAG: hypothetical protein BGO81_21580 [Devosia sp. 66-22]|nr:MAG: hypothetical protein BGO81_21580 [Devosia sp. 66-22]
MNVVLPEGPLVTWYGDDFTGSAAVLEAMEFAGLSSILLLAPPEPDELSVLSRFRGIGIAGKARAKPKEWISRVLPRVFSAMAQIGAPLAHYKICSTLDSSPSTGSIGAAIDLAIPHLGGIWHPVLTAAPPIGRYQAFGNLFAVHGARHHRLDRHPVMSRHPVTPMDESDVALHLARQTSRSIGLIDLLDLRDAPNALARERAAGCELVSIDMLSSDDMVAAGELIWQNRGERLLAIGSQGVENALIRYWQAAGALESPSSPRIRRVSQLVAVSGSASDVTAAQLVCAEACGFEVIVLDSVSCLDPSCAEQAMQSAVAAALSVLARGKSPIVASVRGPDDPQLTVCRNAAAILGLSREGASERLGACLGQILRRVQAASGIERLVVAGGDTSGDVCTAIGIHALTAIGHSVPGAALLAAHGQDLREMSFDVALKGGQMGPTEYFARMRDGCP